MQSRYFDLASESNTSSMFDFRCNNEFFENYLKLTALYDKTNGLGTTHLFIEEKENNHKTLLGFYTLKNSALILKEDNDGQRMGLPAIEISQFAIHKDYERQGIGTIMIKSIIAKTHALMVVSAFKYIILCSVEESVGFYRKNGFELVDEDKMFIPREYWNKNCIPMFKNIIIKK